MADHCGGMHPSDLRGAKQAGEPNEEVSVSDAPSHSHPYGFHTKYTNPTRKWRRKARCRASAGGRKTEYPFAAGCPTDKPPGPAATPAPTPVPYANQCKAGEIYLRLYIQGAYIADPRCMVQVRHPRFTVCAGRPIK
jgi:hypothetical protein